MINLYDSKEISFDNNGLVVLNECISCNIQEELNGLFELELEYPILNNIKKVEFVDPTQVIDKSTIYEKPAKWTYLLEGNIIKADGQLFRIYRKVKNIKSIKINARHISYDLLDNLIDEIDIRGLSCISALSLTMTSTAYSHSFTSMSDIATANDISIDDESGDIIDKNPMETIFKLMELYKAELVRDNYNIKLLGNRGLDRGVLISYSKNIQGIEESLDLDGVCTRIKPIDQDGWTLPEDYIDSPYINNFANPKIKVVTFEDVGDTEDLRIRTKQYFLDSKCDIPQFNYNVDFIELSKTEEYKNYGVLERVYLGDTVTIKHKKLGINLKSKVIKVTKNVLIKRIEKIELGSFKPNMATAIDNSIQGVKDDIVQVTSEYKKAIDNATALITGSKGGNVVIRQTDDGKPYEILIMDTTDVMTAEKVWRWNLGGFGYSSTGVNGQYETAITMDGNIVASFIIALEIHGEQITAGIIKSRTGKCKINLDNETFNLGDKLVFDGANLTFGPAVTLSWGQVTGSPVVLSANDIKSTVITKDYISTLGLVPSYITSTKITSTTIESPIIAGGLIRGAIVQQMNGYIVLNEFSKNDNGGLYTSNDIYGQLNVTIGSESGSGANTGGTIKLYNDNVALPRVELGISSSYGSGIINLKGNNGVVRLALYGDGNLGAGLFVLNSVGSTRSFIREESGQIGGSRILTNSNINEFGFTTLDYITSYYAPKSAPTFTGRAEFNGSLNYRGAEVATKDYITGLGYAYVSDIYSILTSRGVINNGSSNIYITQTDTNLAIWKAGDGTPWISVSRSGELYVHGVLK